MPLRRALLVTVLLTMVLPAPGMWRRHPCAARSDVLAAAGVAFALPPAGPPPLRQFNFSVSLGNGALVKNWKLLGKGTNGVQASGNAEAGGRRAPWIELAADRKRLDALWKEYVPGKPGEVDFGSETVIFLLLGVQETGGYAIEPIAADPPADGVLRVRARLVQPMGDEPTTDSLTAPYAVIAVRARGITKVEWVDADGRLLATRFAE